MPVHHVSVSSILEYHYPFITKVPKEQLLLGLTVERLLYQQSYYFRQKCVYHPRVKMELRDGDTVLVIHGVPDFVNFFKSIIYEVKLYNPQLLKRDSSYRKRVELQLSYYYYMMPRPDYQLYLLMVKVNKRNGEIEIDIPTEVLKARDVPFYFNTVKVKPLPFSEVERRAWSYLKARGEVERLIGERAGIE